MTLHVPDPCLRAEAHAPAVVAGAVPDAVSARRRAADPVPCRLWILSDLSVDRAEHALPDPLPDFDALLVAGGIAPGLCRSVRWLADALRGRQGGRPVVLVPGPAEFLDGEPVGAALAEAVPLGAALGIRALSAEVDAGSARESAAQQGVIPALVERDSRGRIGG